MTYLADLWREARRSSPCGWCSGVQWSADGDLLVCTRRTSIRFRQLVGFEQRGCPEFRILPHMIEDALTDDAALPNTNPDSGEAENAELELSMRDDADL